MSDEITLRRVWHETWTLDNLGHLFLWLKWGAIVEVPLWLAMWSADLDPFSFSLEALPGPIAGTVAVFLRELTQVQSTKFDHNYLRGWPGDRYDGPERKAVWSLHKTMEFVAPSVGGWVIKAVSIAVI